MAGAPAAAGMPSGGASPMGGAPPVLAGSPAAETPPALGGAAGATGGGGAGGLPIEPIDHGDEYVWIDQDFRWDATTSTNVADTGPTNWYDDEGRDYYHGKIEFRVTVTSKADATPIWHELCHWQKELGDPAHVCLHCLPLYSAPGEYTCETTAAQQGGPVDYHQPFVAVQNRVKDGRTGRGKDLATLGLGLPIDYHYTVVLVPAGQPFSGWEEYPLP